MLKSLGLDIHGVIDSDPELFKVFTELYVDLGIEIHIITGAEDKPKIRQQLDDWGIKYHRFFSIVDYHRKLGEKIWYKNGQPWMNPDVWNRTKAKYCAENNIDTHIDDTAEYGKYFEKNNKFILWK